MKRRPDASSTYGIALGFRNLTHYTIRSPLHAGRPKDHLTTTT